MNSSKNQDAAQKHGNAKIPSGSRKRRKLEWTCPRRFVIGFSLFFSLSLVCSFASGVEAEEISSSAQDWRPVFGPESITLGGIRYAPESAVHEWNIRRAIGSSDLTRFEVRQGDEWEEDRSSGEKKERSELDGYKTVWTSGTDVWGAYSFLIEPGGKYHSDWSSIGQMHAAGRDVKPLHIHFNDERLKIYSEAISGSQPMATLRYDAPLARNSWHHIVFHLRQNATRDGRLELWLDGGRVVDYAGTIGSETDYYWKFGIYRGYGPIAATLAVQYANMEIGIADLTKRIGSPLPVR
jgi:hypothetical protein